MQFNIMLKRKAGPQIVKRVLQVMVVIWDFILSTVGTIGELYREQRDPKKYPSCCKGEGKEGRPVGKLLNDSAEKHYVA